MVETGKLMAKAKGGKELLTVDVQNQKPENAIELEKVGIEGLRKLVCLQRANVTYNKQLHHLAG